MNKQIRPMDKYAIKIVFELDKVTVEFYPHTYDDVCKIISDGLAQQKLELEAEESK